MITETLKETLKKLSKDCPYEYIAAITKSGQIVPLRNVHANIEDNFKFRLSEIKDLDVKCIFHTHIKDIHPGTLTSTDIKSSKNCSIPFLLWHTVFDEWDYYDPNDPVNPYPLTQSATRIDQAEYYEGWVYNAIRCNCYTILRSVYAGMLGIVLPNFQWELKDDIKDPNWDRCGEALRSTEGFTRVNSWSIDELKKFDVILMDILGNRNGHHIGVYLGDSKFIHIFSSKHPSKIESFHIYYLERTVSVWRFAKGRHNAA